VTLASASLPASALNSLVLVRERCDNITRGVAAGQSRHFCLQRERLAEAAAFVAQVTRERYADLRIPYHSRWRHFEAGGIDRKAALDRALAGATLRQVARAQIDLAVVSVLLDAGAGAAWRYRERATGHVFQRSEGLAVATFRAFLDGAFSSRGDEPCRVDADALLKLDAGRLAAILQVERDSPLVGLEGRAALLRQLGHALADRASLPVAQPGAIFDVLTCDEARNAIDAEDIVAVMLARWSGIWPTGTVLDGASLGDTWRHPLAGGEGPTTGWVPFHKLTQWLAYSLFEPFEWAGVTIQNRDALTALPEYRNGGLLIDTGVIALRDPELASRWWSVGSELVVEWRALTVALIDELAPLVRDELRAPDLPLACILEGGTWAAGRKLALERRNGAPPLMIESDGTVF